MAHLSGMCVQRLCCIFQVATGSAELPVELIWDGFSGRKGIWPFRFKIDSLKVSQIFGTRVSSSISDLHLGVVCGCQE